MVQFRSAQPLNGKVATLAQETVRVLANSHRDAPHEDVMTCLEGLVNKLQKSGYPPDLACRILRSGMITYQRRLRKEMMGTGRLHRPESEGKSSRTMNRLSGKTNWFRKVADSGVAKLEPEMRATKPSLGEMRSPEQIEKKEMPAKMRIASPLFVPPTKDNKLVKVLKEEDRKLGEIMGWGWRVIERGGIQLSRLLTRSNLFGTDNCGREHCKACMSALKPFDCRRRGVLYETSCTACVNPTTGKSKARYVGESARSIKERFNEHVEDGENERKDSHMWKHWTMHHAGTKT